jgi:fatty-acyl-CoA synthase
MPTLPTWIETISAAGGTITAAPDFAYRLAARLVDPARVNLSTLRIATSGGEVVRLSTIRQFESRFNCPGVVRPGYGMAETTLGVTTLKTGEPLLVDRSGAVSNGRLLRAVEVRILDASGTACPPGESGRIVVKGPTVFAGYLNDPASTAAVLSDGWLETGDDGAIDEAGYLYIHGRRRAMIKRAGASIAPREIEEVVDELPGVRRSAAIGIEARADSVTEDVVVIAEVERGVAAARRLDLREAIAAAVRDAVGARPHDVLLVAPNAIPRTASGKIRYGILKQDWALLRDQPLARG